MKKYIFSHLMLVLLLASCSSTSHLPKGEVLYTGLKEVNYADNDTSTWFADTKLEIEAALACEPNGAIFGSSSLRSPFPISLWIYNAYADSESGFGKWMRDNFGNEPVTISHVNPTVRALVAQNILKSRGYFNGKVVSRVLPKKNSLKAKMAYDVQHGHLYTLDSVAYLGFPSIIDSILVAHHDERLLKTGAPFSVSNLDGERSRISNLLKNNGFFYWRPDYTVFSADSVSVPGKVLLRVEPADDVPAEATRQWYHGKLRLEFRKTMGESLTDSTIRKYFKMFYHGYWRPISPGTVLRDLRFRPGQLFNQTNYLESASNLNSLGIFTMTDFTFTPRTDTDTLDLTVNCVFDKPYDGSIEASFVGKSNSRMGPGLKLGLIRRNVFKGGERLSVDFFGSYEWQAKSNVEGNKAKLNSYEFGVTASLEYPRIEAPFELFSKYRFYRTPTTKFSLSYDLLNRPDYFRMTTLTAGVTYKFQTSRSSYHEFSPLLLDFVFTHNTTARFDSIFQANPVLYSSMIDQFIPKMQYTYTYISPPTSRNPIVWKTTLTESGNVLAMGFAIAGRKYSEKEKNIFGNPFAQFLKIETDLVKTWRVTRKMQLVGHLNVGALYVYGNSDYAPYEEQFYVGGANSLRAFSIRGVGPGDYFNPDTRFSFFDQTGTLRFLSNLELRVNFFGSIYGALFADAGNVWNLQGYEDYRLKPKNFFKQLATDVGVGIRYDLEFLVLRLDWGIAIHVPYNTSRKGYYNIPRFKDGQGLHFAVGYPF